MAAELVDQERGQLEVAVGVRHGLLAQPQTAGMDVQPAAGALGQLAEARTGKDSVASSAQHPDRWRSGSDRSHSPATSSMSMTMSGSRNERAIATQLGLTYSMVLRDLGQKKRTR